MVGGNWPDWGCDAMRCDAIRWGRGFCIVSPAREWMGMDGMGWIREGRFVRCSSAGSDLVRSAGSVIEG